MKDCHISLFFKGKLIPTLFLSNLRLVQYNDVSFNRPKAKEEFHVRNRNTVRRYILRKEGVAILLDNPNAMKSRRLVRILFGSNAEISWHDWTDKMYAGCWDVWIEGKGWQKAITYRDVEEGVDPDEILHEILGYHLERKRHEEMRQIFTEYALHKKSAIRQWAVEVFRFMEGQIARLTH